MGGDITQEMIRRRSEHNECVLYTMEELVLQEESIERIDKTLGTLCPHLKILYIPNNLIPRLENLYKLRELEYLNMAMNNITKDSMILNCREPCLVDGTLRVNREERLQIEGLEKCEQLQKLDLTLNFVDLNNLPSVASLNANVHLTELFLTGNPCTDWDGCRSYIITKLPHVKRSLRLDAWDIKPRERITALQEMHRLEEDLQAMNSSEIVLPSIEPQVSKDEKGEPKRTYTPDTRVAEHRELQELREGAENKSKRPDSERKPSTRRKGFDPLPVNGRIYQRNEGGWDFKLDEADCGTKVVLDVAVSKFLDTSLIDIDVQPLLIRILVKGKLLQLHLPAEVKTDASSAERSLTTGHLVVSMPLAVPHAPFKLKYSPDYYITAPKVEPKVEAPAAPPVDIHNITNKTQPPKQYPRTNCIYPPKATNPGPRQPPSWAEDVPKLE